MNKRERHEKLLEIIGSKRIGGQHQLRQELKRLGIRATQATISRDLVELGVVKVKNTYRIPVLVSRRVPTGEILEIDSAGENLIVVKTPPGQASMTALAIDRLQIPGIVGTVAGDDTFFVATKSHTEQKMVMKHILKNLR
jgi:transcriptional regulator of arginine metabolism